MIEAPLVRRLAVVCACVFFVGCEPGTESTLGPPGDALLAGAVQDAGQPVFYWLSDQMVEGAASSLTRTPNGVNYQLTTRDLEPGHAYTLWIVIFNDTAACEDGVPGVFSCGAMDVLNDAARPDMMFAAGVVAGGSGKATFSGRRSVGDLSGSANGPIGVPAYGLEDAYGAEIHLVVHSHGPKLPAFMPDMIQTIDGGCFDAGVPEAGVPVLWNAYDGPAGVGAFGRRGPNTCASVQVAVHPAGA
jgi:hypothetical protein